MQGGSQSLGSTGILVGPGCTHISDLGRVSHAGFSASNAVFTVPFLLPLITDILRQSSVGMGLKLMKASPCCCWKQIFTLYNLTATFKMWTRYSERELPAAVLNMRSNVNSFSCLAKDTLLQPLLRHFCHFLTTAPCPRKKIPLTESKPLLYTSNVVQNEGRHCLWIASFWANLGLSLHFLMYSLDLACCLAWQTLCAGEPLQLHAGTHTWVCWDTEPCCTGLGARELRFQGQAEVDVKSGPLLARVVILGKFLK